MSPSYFCINKFRALSSRRHSLLFQSAITVCGTSGTPGGNGGHFYGRFQKASRLNKLTLNVSGGRGGNGGNGVDGQCGEDGKDEIHQQAAVQAPIRPVGSNVGEYVGYNDLRARRIAKITAWSDANWIYAMQFSVRIGRDTIQDFPIQGPAGAGNPQTINLHPQERITEVWGSRNASGIPTGGLEHLVFKTSLGKQHILGHRGTKNFHLTTNSPHNLEAVQFHLWSSRVGPLGSGPTVLGGCDPTFDSVIGHQGRTDGKAGSNGGDAGQHGAGGKSGFVVFIGPESTTRSTIHQRDGESGSTGRAGAAGRGGRHGYEQGQTTGDARASDGASGITYSTPLPGQAQISEDAWRAFQEQYWQDFEREYLKYSTNRKTATFVRELPKIQRSTQGGGVR